MTLPGILPLLLLSAPLSPPGMPASGPPSPPLEAVLTAERQVITVGDWIPVTLAVSRERGIRLEPPEIDREAGPFTVGELTGPEESEGDDGRLLSLYRFPVTLYRPGTHTFPPVRVRGTDADSGEEIAAASTAPLRITVSSVLTDSDPEPADIKGQADLPAGIGRWPWVLAALAAGGAAAWAYLRRRRMPEGPAGPAPAGPEVPAHEWAYRELERLLGSGLLPGGQIKQFYVELAEILKGYLNRRFRIPTLERTTEEVIRSLEAARTTRKAVPDCRHALSRCDLVKFARYRPPEAESRDVVDLAYRIVDGTRVRETGPPAPVPPGGTPGAGFPAGGR